MITWVVDNDVLFKGTCYGFLGTLIASVGPVHAAGVLGQAKFVLPKKLRKRPPSVGAHAAIKSLEASLACLQTIEPTDEEIAFAATLEFEATQRKVDFDAGESTLAAVLLMRNLNCIFTGDKRAVAALQALIQENVDGIVPIKNKTVCLEQGCRWMIQRGLATIEQIRGAICANRNTDIALAICFSCSSPELPYSDEGLIAYIEDLRKKGPDVLYPA